MAAAQESAEASSRSLSFELVSPERVEVSRAIRMVTLPGSEGQFAVLKDHAPLVAALRPGLVVIEDDHGPAENFFVDGGFVEVGNNVCTVMVERAIALSAINREKIIAELAELKSKEPGLISAELPSSGGWSKKIVLEAMVTATAGQTV